MANKRDGSPQAQKGGRKVGAATRLTRVRANEICASGQDPLSVMNENMLFWHEAASAMGERIKRMIEKDQLSKEEQSALVDILSNFECARENAQRCAVDAAPYVHPKLQSIAMQRAAEEVVITMEIPPPAYGEDRSYRDGRSNGGGRLMPWGNVVIK